MKTSAFLYPWDVVGDPDAAARVADLGVQQVTLAAAYHSTRALTPRHPGRRIVTAEHAAVLYPPGAARWAGRELRPYEQSWVASADPYAEAAQALTDAGLEVHTWVVLAHNSRLGAEHPDTSVVNAYGDRYPGRRASHGPRWASTWSLWRRRRRYAVVRAAPSWSPAAGTASRICTPTTRSRASASGTRHSI